MSAPFQDLVVKGETVTPDRKQVVDGKIVEEFYWAGEYVVYIDGHLSKLGFDRAVASLRPAAQPAQKQGEDRG